MTALLPPATFVFRSLENTDGVHRPPLEGGSAHPTSVLSGSAASHLFYADVRRSNDSYSRQAVLTDFRIKTITEVLSGMLSVKAFCWEQPFITKISGARKDEAKNIRKSQAMSGVNLTLQVAAPALSSMVTFLVCWHSGKELKLSTVLQTVALLQVLRTSVGKKFVRFMEAFPEAHSAVHRLQEFLLLPEIKLPSAPTELADGAAVSFRNATFAWPRDESGDADAHDDGSSSSSGSATATGAPPTIAVKDLTLNVHTGDLVIVNGAVGAGKTALLQSVLGELETASGSFEVTPGAAFVPQSSWIMASDFPPSPPSLPSSTISRPKPYSLCVCFCFGVFSILLGPCPVPTTVVLSERAHRAPGYAC